jgi:hypothetical protein
MKANPAKKAQAFLEKSQYWAEKAHEVLYKISNEVSKVTAKKPKKK